MTAELMDNLVLRAAASETLMRPALTDLAYKRTASFNSFRFTDGNPDLKPTYAKQWEVGLEKYLPQGGLISASYFSKTIEGVAHLNHVPILIMMNAKDGKPALPGGVTPLPYDAKAYDALDAEIRLVFGADRLITPDDVRGKAKTLREGALAGSWPTLEAARGKVFFALDESPEKVKVYSYSPDCPTGNAWPHRRFPLMLSNLEFALTVGFSVLDSGGSVGDRRGAVR